MQTTGGGIGDEVLTFSVVIPTFDRPESLRRSLDSLVDQRLSKEAFEVIVVDDGSSFPVQAVAGGYESLIGIMVYRQERAGPAAARNAGAERARAKYIVFLDDDCYADPLWLPELERAFAMGNSRPLCGGTVTNGFPENVFAEVGELILGVIFDYYRPEPGGMYFFRAANLAVSAKEFRRVGGFNVGFRTAEDREFCDRWLHGGGSLVHVPNARVAHYNRLSFRSFCRQHFFYGKGAFHFHRVRRRRGSGKFHLNFLLYYLRVFRAALIPTPSSIAAKVGLLLVWQSVNLAGFVTEWVDHIRLRKESQIS